MRIEIKPRRDLLLLYTVANVYSVMYALINGRFMGLPASDLVEVNFKFLFFSFAFVILYYLVLFPVFNFFSSINFALPHLYDPPGVNHSLVGFIIFVLQFLYFLLVIFFDAGKVGVEDVSVPFSKIWAFLQIDFLAIYYLASSRGDAIYRANIFLFVMSNLVRGWTGFLMVLVFIYLVRKEFKYYLNARHLLVSIVGILIIIPFILFLKFFIRTRQVDVEIDGFLKVAFGYDNYLDFFVYSFENAINRVQQFTLTWFAWDFSAPLSRAYTEGKIASFMVENLYGSFLLKISGSTVNPNLGVFLTQYIPYDFDFVYGSFNVSPGLLGWMAVVGNNLLEFLLFLIIVFLLGFVLIQLIYRRGTQEWFRLISALWLMWLMLLLPGWMNQFVASIHALLVFLFIGALSGKFKFKRVG